MPYSSDSELHPKISQLAIKKLSLPLWLFKLLLHLIKSVSHEVKFCQSHHFRNRWCNVIDDVMWCNVTTRSHPRSSNMDGPLSHPLSHVTKSHVEAGWMISDCVQAHGMVKISLVAVQSGHEKMLIFFFDILVNFLLKEDYIIIALHLCIFPALCL